MTTGQPITAEEKLRCAERELKWRGWVYPKRVAGGQMTKEKAAHEMACMAAIVEDCRRLADKERLL